MTSQVMKRQAYLGHAKLFLSQLKKWNAAISTPQCLESLNAIESIMNNIIVAFLRTIDPNELDQPEMTRDFAIMIFDYYDKRSLWDQWGDNIGPHGLSACERLGDIYSMSEAYPMICNCFGIVRRMQGNNSEAMRFYELALSRGGSDKLKSDALTNMADIYRLQGQADQALQCAQQAIQLGRSSGDSNREAKGLEYLGLTYTLLGDYDEAIKLYEQALHLREEVGNLPRIALVLTQLSYALTHRGREEDLHQALLYYRRSYAIDVQIGNWQSVARYWGDVAVTYTKLDEYQKSIDNLEQALDRNETIGFRRGVALNHVRLTENFLNLNNYEKALFHCEQACNNLQYLTNFDRKIALAGFSDALLNLGRYMQSCSKLTEATTYVKLAIELAEEVKASNIQQTAMYLLQRLESSIDEESADSQMISPEDCLGCQVARGITIPESNFVYADEFWTVNHMLAPSPFLGWLVLQPRRHMEALYEMTSEEHQRMAQLMVYLDNMLRSLLAPSKVYVCLFAEAAHCPHIHFHIIPRAPEIESRGPEIFRYEPETRPSEEDIVNFIRQAQAHLKSLMENTAK